MKKIVSCYHSWDEEDVDFFAKYGIIIKPGHEMMWFVFNDHYYEIRSDYVLFDKSSEQISHLYTIYNKCDVVSNEHCGYILFAVVVEKIDDFRCERIRFFVYFESKFVRGYESYFHSGE